MSSRLLLFCLLLLPAAAGFCQIPESPQAPPSPNAFAFDQVRKVPVYHFTGLPTLQIPLSQTTYKTTQVNMGLSYHASGFKPDQHASWVGTGWTLQVGGAITRQVNGLPDEYAYTMYNQVNAGQTATYNLGWIKGDQFIGYSYGLNFLMNGGGHWVDKKFQTGLPHEYVKYPWPLPYRGSYMGASCVITDRFYQFHLMVNEVDSYYPGTRDVQRDEFSFNVFGYSGKFYFKDNNEIVVVSDKKFRVERIAPEIPIPASLLQPNADPQAGATCPQWMLGMSPYKSSNYYPKTLAGFSLQAEDGTIFTFGNYQPGQDAIEYSIGENYKLGTAGFGQQNYTDHWIANTWYLTSVRFPDGRWLCLDYQRDEYIRTIYNSEMTLDVQQNSQSPGCGNANSTAPLPGQIAASKIISPVYLKRVFGDVAEFNFTYSNTNESNLLTTNAVQNFKWKKLDTVEVKDMMGMHYKWAFTYDALANWSQRLFLNKVERLDPTNVPTGERYLFQYNNHLTLPNYNAGANDHWGYWNGTPSTSVYGKSNGLLDTLRSPSLTHTLAGVLKKVIYPTGGYREFTYEQNTCRKKVKMERMLGVDSLAANFPTGGLRIASIRTVDTVTGQANTTRYFYVSDYNPALTYAQNAALPSSGVRNSHSYVYHWQDVIGQFYAPFPTCLQNLKFKISSNQPMNAILDDYHVGYSTVVEVRQDSAYTVRRFTNHDNGHADDSLISSVNPFASPYRRYSSRSLQRGKISFEGHYTKTGKLIQSTETEYTIVPAYSGGPAKTFLDAWALNIIDANNGNGSVSAWEVIPVSYIFSDQYKEYTYGYLPARVTNKLYHDNAAQAITTVQEMEYNSPFHWQVTALKNTNSNGKISQQVIKYPADYPSTFVTDRLVNSYWLTTPIEKINLFKDSATGPLKVKGALLSEFAINPYSSGEASVPMNTYSLKVDSPFLYAEMGTTVPVTYSYPSTSAWTKDPRYRLDKYVKKYDSLFNILEAHTADGQKTWVHMGYRGLKTLGLHTLSTGSFWIPAYTSFETLPVRAVYDYATVQTIPDNPSWILIGNRDTTVAFTGKNSFVGRVKYNGIYITGRILLAARASGATPTLERYDPNSGTYIPITTVTPTLIGQKDGWKIWQYIYGNAGIQFVINTNGNQIDELRMGANSNGDLTHFSTVTYVGNRMTEKTDARYMRIRFEYDKIGRLVRVRDDNGKILEQYEYKFRIPSN